MPKKDSSTANLHIRLPSGEKSAFETAAAKQGFDLTTWVRLWLRKAAGLDRR